MAYTSRLAKTVDKLATPDVVKASEPDKAEKQPGCNQCFGDGWPDDATSVGCEHGMWIRDSDSSL